jgi:hypothetical protein
LFDVKRIPLISSRIIQDFIPVALDLLYQSGYHPPNLRGLSCRVPGKNAEEIIAYGIKERELLHITCSSFSSS